MDAGGPVTGAVGGSLGNDAVDGPSQDDVTVSSLIVNTGAVCRRCDCSRAGSPADPPMTAASGPTSGAKRTPTVARSPLRSPPGILRSGKGSGAPYGPQAASGGLVGTTRSHLGSGTAMNTGMKMSFSGPALVRDRSRAQGGFVQGRTLCHTELNRRRLHERRNTPMHRSNRRSWMPRSRKVRPPVQPTVQRRAAARRNLPAARRRSP